MDNVVLSLLAHPDDAEFLCAGTLIRLKDLGWQVHIATMTPGDCGSTEHPPEQIAGIRRSEGASAAQTIGASFHCVEERDLRVAFGEAVLERVVDLLCEVRPKIVITHSPDDYHLDHEMTSKIVRAATFAAPIPNFLHGRWKLPPLEQIPYLYYCDPLEGKDIYGNPIPPGFCIEITQQIEVKERMLACHASQRSWLSKHHEVDNYLLAMKHWSAEQGKACGVGYAEGFRQHLGHSYPQNNLVGELLGLLLPSRR